jgi:hypothetical protein
VFSNEFCIAEAGSARGLGRLGLQKVCSALSLAVLIGDVLKV